MWTLTFVEKANKSSKVVNASLLNKTEHYLFKKRTKYIVFFIYIVTNIVMPRDSYTAKVWYIISSDHVRSKNRLEMEHNKFILSINIKALK